MSKRSLPPVIRLRGVRHNNLKGFDLDLPLHRLIVVTGLSGSGKSSLAFDTLFAEGQRRYIETFSPYARQFFDRMDKPRVDSIEGIPPAIAIEQRNAVRTTRSTVGTMTEICDYLKVLWPHLAQLHCRQCDRPVRPDSAGRIWETLWAEPSARGGDLVITFDLPLSEKLALADCLALVARQGYQRLWLEGEPVRIDEASARLEALRPSHLTVVQDRLKLTPSARARLVEACEQAYHFGKGRLSVHLIQADARTLVFSNRRHCATCDLEYRDPSPALFSFNHPSGACPTCRGFGRTISIDYDLAIPDRSRTLAGGAIRPWQTGVSAECQQDLMKFCRVREVPVDVPFNQLSAEHQRWVVEGDPDYGRDPEHEWPRAWYGVKGYFRWLESKAYKMHVRVLLSRYRTYQPCPACRGTRLQPEALLYRVEIGTGTAGEPGGLTLADLYALPIQDALAWIERVAATQGWGPTGPLGVVLEEVKARLTYLVDVGLGYLTLDRPTRTLSGGETERVNLATCLGARLVNTLFVLDEPTVGLHPRDTAKLVRIIERLRDAGNTIVVVEHEAGVIRAADQVVDLGPGHGESGGDVVYSGPLPGLLKCAQSLTGQYLSGRHPVEPSTHRPVDPAAMDGTSQNAGRWLVIEHASRHNLRDLTVAIPLARFVCVTGVSGSGKTTLVKEVLLPLVQERLQGAPTPTPNRDADSEGEGEDNASERSPLASASVRGWEALGRVMLVDQTPLGKTPRSNPAVYVGAFDAIRDLFARSETARERGLEASAFSFNSRSGQCERCRGAGFEKIEMQFLSDVFIRCPDCDGRRYRRHILEIAIAPPPSPSPAVSSLTSPPKSIADLLDGTVDEAVGFLRGFGDLRPARLACEKLALLQEVGLGYLRLGQPINTLSGGESQRLKLVSHLAESVAVDRSEGTEGRSTQPGPEAAKPTLFLFDEPTTGLHFDDVRVLLRVFRRLVAAGHSVVVIEHNLEVIRACDWAIDLGPEAGDAGGRLVFAGPPGALAKCRTSLTGQALAPDGFTAIDRKAPIPNVPVVANDPS